MIDALIQGKLHAKAQQRTGKAGRPFVTAKVTTMAKDGNAQFVNVIAFAPDACNALLALGAGDAVALAGELASRLAREEIAARGSMELARQQALLNRLVIEEMADGVLVVDRELRVRATNPAARSLLTIRPSVSVIPICPSTTKITASASLTATCAWDAIAEAMPSTSASQPPVSTSLKSVPAHSAS